MIYLKILALALVLFVFLRSLSYIFAILPGNKLSRIVFLRIFPIYEMLLWISYVLWASNQLFNDLDFYPLLIGSIIVVFVALFGWYMLRDFVSGFILKAENAFEPGQTIKTPIVSGTIKKLGYRSIEIISYEGETVKVPFSLLSNKHITKPAENGRWVGQVIILIIASKFQPDKTQDMLRKRIIEMPWIITASKIDIKLKRENAENYLAEINVHTINPEMVLKTEENLKIFVREVFG
jgi:small-conductance mechanosensitive channel